MDRLKSSNWSPDSLSPTSTRIALKKKSKKVHQLEEELEAEFTEKSDIIAENCKLKEKLDSVSNQLNLKSADLERLKIYANELEQNITNFNESVDNQKVYLDNGKLKTDMRELQKYIAQLEDSNSQLENKVEKYEAKIKSLGEQVEDYFAAVQLLKSEINERDSRIDNMSKDNNLLRREIVDLKQVHLTLKEEFDRQSGNSHQGSFSFDCADSLQREIEFENLKGENKNLNHQLVSLSQEKLEIESQKESLASKLRDCESNIADMREKFEKKEIETGEKLLFFLNEKSSLESELVKLKDELKDTLEKFESSITLSRNNELQLQKLQTMLNEKIQEFDVLSGNFEKAQQERDHFSKCIDEYQEKNSSLTETVSVLEKKHESLVIERDSLLDRVCFLSKSLDNVQGNRLELQNELSALNFKLMESKKEIEGLKYDYKALTENNATYSKLLNKAEVDVQKLKKNRCEIESRLLDFQNENSALIEDHVALKSTYELLNQEHVSLKSTCEKWKTSFDEQAFTISNLNFKILSLSKEKSELISNFNRLEDSHADLNSKFETFEQDTRQKYAMVLEEKKTIETRCQNAEEELNKLTTKNSELASKYEEMSEIQSKELEDAKITCKKLIASCTGLENENKEQLSEILKLKMEYNELKQSSQESLRKAEMKIVDFVSEMSSMIEYCKNFNGVDFEKNRNVNSNLDMLKLYISSLVQEHSSAQKQLKKIASERDSLLFQIDELKCELDSVNERNFALKNKLVDIQSACEYAKEEKESISRLIENLEREIRSLVCEKEALEKKLKLEISKFRETEKSLSGKCQRFIDENTFLICIYDELEQKNRELLSSMKDIETNHSDLKAEYDKFILDLEILKDSNLTLTKKIREAEKKIHSDLIQNGELKIRIAYITAEKETVIEEKRKLEDQNKELEKSFDQSKISSTELLSQMDLKAKELETALNMTENIKTTFMEKIQKMESEIESLCLERASLSEKNNVLTQMNDCKMNDFQKQYKKIESAKNIEINELREMFLYQIHQIQKSNEELKSENKNLLVMNQEKKEFLKRVDAHIQTIMQEMKIGTLPNGNFSVFNETEKLNSIYQQLEHEETQLRLLVVEKENLNSQLDSLMEKIEQHEADHLKLEEILAQEKETLEKLKKNEQRLCEEIEILHEKNSSLQSQIDELNTCVQNLHNEKSETNLSLEEKMAELQQVRELLAEKETCIFQLLENEQFLNQEKLELQNQLQKLEGDNKEIKEKMADLLKQKEDLYYMEKMNNDAFKGQIEAIEMQNHNLKEEIEACHSVIEEMTSEKEKLKTESKVLEANNGTITQLDSVLKEKQLRENQLLDQIETLNVKLASETQRASEAQKTYSDQLEKHLKYNKVLEEKLQNYETNEKCALSNRIQELKKKIEEVVENNEKLTDELRSRVKDMDQLIKENENLMVKIEDLESNLKALKIANAVLSNENEESRKFNDSLKMKINLLEQMLNAEVDSREKLKDEYEIFKEEYRKLTQHKDELGNELKDTFLQENKKLSDKVEDLENLKNKLNEQLQEKEDNIQLLMTKLEELEIKIKEPCLTSSDLNKTHIIASGPENERYVALRKENLKLIDEIDRCKTKLKEMEAEVENLKEIYKEKAKKLYQRISANVLTEYEGKLQRAKAEHIKIISGKFDAKENEWRKKIEEYRMMIKKANEHNKELSSQLWNTNDKLLRCQQAHGVHCSEASIQFLTNYSVEIKN